MYSEVYTLFLFCQNPFSNMRQLLLCNRFYITEYFFVFLGKPCAARRPRAMPWQQPAQRSGLAPVAATVTSWRRGPSRRAGAVTGCRGAGCPRGHAGQNCFLPEWFLICLCTWKLCIWKHCKCHPIPISLCIFSTLMLLLKLI